MNPAVSDGDASQQAEADDVAVEARVSDLRQDFPDPRLGELRRRGVPFARLTHRSLPVGAQPEVRKRKRQQRLDPAQSSQ